MHADADGSVVAVDGGPGYGFAAHPSAAHAPNWEWLSLTAIEMFRLDDSPVGNRFLTRAIAHAQRRHQAFRLEQRKQVLRWQRIPEEQREIVYEVRGHVLKGNSEELAEEIHHSLASVVTNLVARHAPRGRPNAWDLYGLYASLAANCPPGLRREELNLKSPSSAGPPDAAHRRHRARLGGPRGRARP